MTWLHATLSIARPETREHGSDVRLFYLDGGTREWIEAPPKAEDRAYRLDRALVTRGKIGELLAQEYLADFPNADRLRALARDADALRAGEDATRWSPERRAAIAAADERVAEELYATPFPLKIVLTLFSDAVRDELCDDFRALLLPHGLVVDGVFDAGTESRPWDTITAGSPRRR